MVVFRDHTWPSMLKQKLCVTVQFTNSAGASVAGSCTFSDRENSRHACLIRQEIPLSWFPVSQGAATAVGLVAHFSVPTLRTTPRMLPLGCWCVLRCRPLLHCSANITAQFADRAHFESQRAERHNAQSQRLRVIISLASKDDVSA